MTSDVTADTHHRGLMIRDPSKAGLFLAGYEAYWPSPHAPGRSLAWKTEPPARSGRGHQSRPTKSKSAEIPKLVALIKTKVHASDPVHFPYLRANGPINPSPGDWLLSHMNMEACRDFRCEDHHSSPGLDHL